MRLGHFDPIGPLQDFTTAEVCSDYSVSLSHNGPVQASALLKNDGATLPLAPTKAGTVAVLGPALALKPDVSYYGPHTPCGNHLYKLTDAVSSHSDAKVVSALGVPDVLSTNTSGIAEAVALASSADHVILGVGTDLNWAHEEHDAEVNGDGAAAAISFTDAQVQLIEQVAAAAKKPIVLLTFTATPLDLSAVLANPKIGAVLHVGQPSVTVIGVGELLFGKA